MLQQYTCFSLDRAIDRHPLTVDSQTLLSEVVSLMQDDSCALVVENSRLQGIFTSGDLIRLIAAGTSTAGVTIGEVMTQEVIALTFTGAEDLFTALELLRSHRIRHLPVVDRTSHLLGLITFTPVQICHIFEAIQRQAFELKHDAFGVFIEPGENFFFSLVKYLSKTLGVDGAYVGKLVEPELVKIQTIAFHGGEGEKNFEYDLAGTPGENIVKGELCIYPSKIQQLFPNDLWLQNMSAESYAGMPILDPTGKALGLIAIVDKKPFSNVVLIEEVLKILAVRTTLELERQQAQIRLQTKAKQQEAIAQLGQYALIENMSSLIERGVNLVASTLDVEYCKVLELLPEGKNFLLKAGVGWHEGLVGNATVRADTNSQAGYTLHSTEPVVVTDLSSETRFKGPDLLLDHQVVSGVSVIIAGNKQPFGILGVHTTKHRIFTQDDLNFIWAIANIIAQANERQQTASALQEREKLYRILVTSAPAGIFQTDASGNCLYVNQRWQEMTGLSFSEALGEGWSNALHPDDRDRVYTEWYQAAQTEREFNSEYRFVKDNREIVWVAGRAVALYDNAGLVTGYLGTVTDISERQRRETILRDIASGISIEVGEKFLPSLVEYLSKTLEVDYAYIGVLQNARRERIETLAVYKKGQIADNFEYNIVGTPCHNVIENDFCVYPKAVQQLFPDSPLLPEMSAESFAGMSIVNTAGDTIGLIAIVDSKPFENVSLIEEVLTIFVTRLSTELERQQAEADLAKSNQILQAIGSIQTQYLTDAEPRSLFDGMLTHLLELSESEYGFIGEIQLSADGCPKMEEGYMKLRGRPDLKTHAIADDTSPRNEFEKRVLTNIAWNRETRAFHAENAPKEMEFHHLETLFEAVIVTGEPVIANSPSTDPRSGGIPKRHPEVHAFLAIPFYKNERMTGMVGIANRQDGYNEQLVNYLRPFIDTCSRIIEAYKSDRQRRQAETKIRQQAALLDVATDAIMVRTLDDRVLFWSQGAEKLYGWKETEVLKLNANELLHRSSTTDLNQIHQTVREKGEWQGELNHVTKSSKEIVVESRWTLVKDDLGRPQSYLVVNTDITEQKYLQAQFLRTQRMESLGTLAGGIAHDLNNILAPILGFSKLLPLKLANVDEQTKGFFKIMENNANRGTALVRQILTFSRGLEGERGIVQIRHLITEIAQIVKETFPKSIELATNVPRNLWTVNADVNQLHQVLMNLAVNARDAMSDGGTLTINAENITIDAEYARLHLDAKIGSYVLISVTDTGIGIAPEVIDRIFEPFFTTKEVGRGTGLGLSTTMGIIKSHDGFVDVISDRQQHSSTQFGTQFNVFLPASDTTENDTEEPPAETLYGSGELILVVDDETAILEVTKATLETYNYQVLTAMDGIEAIAVYARHQVIKAVIMDIMMPSMNGKTAIRTFKKINPQIPIIAVSGAIERQEIVAELNNYVTAFMSKPYANDMLLKTLRDVVNS